jgi:hypothetical protein
MTLTSSLLRVGVVLGMLCCRSSPSSVDVAILSCSGATTLDELSGCVTTQMPAFESGGFFQPSAKEQADWRRVVRAMLEGACEQELPASLADVMQRRAFHDSSNGRQYCVFLEVLDADRNGYVDRGWGTVIVYPNAIRELHHHAPHPLADAMTEQQALGIFRETESRGYLMAGTHRNSNRGSSSCQGAYAPADVAHNVENMFHAANQELVEFYANTNWWVIQWHGMAPSDCEVNVYLSHGRNAAPATSDKIYQLKESLLTHHSTWKVAVAGGGACSLHGATNTQGRLINGVPASEVCRVAANRYSGRFLHIEQHYRFRSFAEWVRPVSEVWQ